MKTICQQCKKEIEQNQLGTRLFCDDACRKANSRSKSDILPKSDIKSDKTLFPRKFKERTYTLEEVCSPDNIRLFPNMCETKRLQAEAVYRLENNDIEELRSAGISIPNAYGSKKKNN